MTSFTWFLYKSFETKSTVSAGGTYTWKLIVYIKRYKLSVLCKINLLILSINSHEFLMLHWALKLHVSCMMSIKILEIFLSGVVTYDTIGPMGSARLCNLISDYIYVGWGVIIVNCYSEKLLNIIHYSISLFICFLYLSFGSFLCYEVADEAYDFDNIFSSFYFHGRVFFICTSENNDLTKKCVWKYQP